LEWGFGAVGLSREKVQGEGVCSIEPFSGGLSGVGLSRIAGVTDTHSYKSESKERVGGGRAEGWTSVGRGRTAC
jgi:hypothetical protein